MSEQPVKHPSDAIPDLEKAYRALVKAQQHLPITSLEAAKVIEMKLSLQQTIRMCHRNRTERTAGLIPEARE